MTRDEREAFVDDSFAALVRGPSSTFPRGYPYLIPVWIAVGVGALLYGWNRLVGAIPVWYGGLALSALVLAITALIAVFATIRRLAFRADANGIRLGVRTARKRPRQRQALLWWSDVQRLSIAPRHDGSVLEITLGPAARIVRRRSLLRQALLMCGMLILPLWLGRGTPRLTEPRGSAPQYRVRLNDVQPDELGVALAALALPAVDIVVMSRRRGPLMARRPQQVTAPAA
ncbi:MAG TPA: hypothetical protein VIJ82_29080 [Streptosporangiaceae bacterium]|jgi:hypothetical protein